jgi:hypothetical protein
MFSGSPPTEFGPEGAGKGHSLGTGSHAHSGRKIFMENGLIGAFSAVQSQVTSFTLE